MEIRFFHSLIITGLVAASVARGSFRDDLAARPELWSKPATHSAAEPVYPGVKSLYYSSVPYQGRPTEVFALLAMPDPTWPRPVPGVVLVHGGGGTAFVDFVKKWTARGYAAIAMDLEGHVPIRQPADSTGSAWRANPLGGPARVGIFGDIARPLEDQWMFHAVAAITRSRVLLATQPGVDPARIGICGFSWGGILAAVTAGIDPRLRFAIPIYGCGHLDEADTMFGRAFAKMTPQDRVRAKTWWDPAAYVGAIKMPSLWIDGTNDAHFSLNAWEETVRATAGAHWATLIRDLPHGGKPAWERPESYAFADMVVRGGPALLRWKEPKFEGGRLAAAFDGAKPEQVEIFYAADARRWQEREWMTVPATVGSVEASAPLPSSARWVFLNARDAAGNVISSDLIAPPPQNQPTPKR